MAYFDIGEMKRRREEQAEQARADAQAKRDAINAANTSMGRKIVELSPIFEEAKGVLEEMLQQDIKLNRKKVCLEYVKGGQYLRELPAENAVAVRLGVRVANTHRSQTASRAGEELKEQLSEPSHVVRVTMSLEGVTLYSSVTLNDRRKQVLENSDLSLEAATPDYVAKVVKGFVEAMIF